MLLIERPGSAAEAEAAQRRAMLGKHPWAFVAGGTALQLGWGGRAPELQLVDVGCLPEAQGVVLAGDRLRLGAGVRIEVLRRDLLVCLHAPLLAQACGTLAALSVRHLGTLGGNIGWGFGDTLPALLAMDAEAELGDGRRVPLDALMDEATLPLLLAVHVEAGRFGGDAARATRAFQEKVGLRAAFSPARINVALTARVAADAGLSAVRVGIGAAGVKAQRMPALERSLEGLPPPQVRAAGLAEACRRDLPHDEPLALLAASLVAGHLQREAP